VLCGALIRASLFTSVRSRVRVSARPLQNIDRTDGQFGQPCGLGLSNPRNRKLTIPQFLVTRWVKTATGYPTQRVDRTAERERLTQPGVRRTAAL